MAAGFSVLRCEIAFDGKNAAIRPIIFIIDFQGNGQQTQYIHTTRKEDIAGIHNGLKES
jgi:hypothetical protein